MYAGPGQEQVGNYFYKLQIIVISDHQVPLHQSNVTIKISVSGAMVAGQGDNSGDNNTGCPKKYSKDIKLRSNLLNAFWTPCINVLIFTTFSLIRLLVFREASNTILTRTTAEQFNT